MQHTSPALRCAAALYPRHGVGDIIVYTTIPTRRHRAPGSRILDEPADWSAMPIGGHAPALMGMLNRSVICLDFPCAS